MSKLKVSRFNIFYPKEGDKTEVIAYNSFKNSLALISCDEYEAYKMFESESVYPKDKELIKQFIEQGILIKEEIDELDSLKAAVLRDRFDASVFGVTIAPTMRCNFDCIYCYQKGRRDGQSMSEDIQKKLIDFIKKGSEKSETLTVSWYGGEPLVAIDVIKKLSEEFINMCEERNIKYYSNMVTNGYLLTPEVIKMLIKYKIYKLQITIDGPPDIHDSRRYLINSKKQTFNTIIENIENIFKMTRDISIDIRINVDKKNINRVNEITEILKNKGLLDKVYCYLGYVESNNDCYEEEECMEYDTYMSDNEEFLKEIKNITNRDIVDYPIQMAASCGADRMNTYLISPKGKIFKCWSEINIDEHNVGDLSHGEVEINKSFTKYLLYDVTTDPDCKECKLIPICMGGCSNHRLNKTWHRCSQYKYKLEEILNKKVISMQ